METDTVVDARVRLELLRDELANRGWQSQLEGESQPSLKIANPRTPALQGAVKIVGDSFRWSWGADIGQVSDVSGAADHVVHVLRGIEGDS